MAADNRWLKNERAETEISRENFGEIERGKDDEILMKFCSDRCQMASSKKWETHTIDEDVSAFHLQHLNLENSEKFLINFQIVKVHTVYTLRSKELRKLYLALQDETSAGRPEILQKLREVVSDFDCHLTRDIAELIMREENLLQRGEISHNS